MQTDVESGKHPPAMTKLLERQLNECGEWPYPTVLLMRSVFRLLYIEYHICPLLLVRHLGVLISQVFLELQSLVHLTVLWLYKS